MTRQFLNQSTVQAKPFENKFPEGVLVRNRNKERRYLNPLGL